MRKILITGANSYIGTSLEKYLRQWPEDYHVDTVDMIDGSWRQKDFHGYDSVFHVAGIAHQKETRKNAHLYYEINRDLAVETARKAQTDGVSQFIFLSSMSIYGVDTGVITPQTMPRPKSYYGKSKWEAELKLSEIGNPTFKIAILRPPMIYGLDCKGNFQTLVKLARMLPVFPKMANQRSMLYIDNLMEFVKEIIDEKRLGIFFPQNKEYVNTYEMVKMLGESIGRKIYPDYLSPILIMIGSCFCSKFRKAFGTLIYKNTETMDYHYCITDFAVSISKSIR